MFSLTDYSKLIYGYEQTVPTLYGEQRYLNFDNAASTPPFKAVMDLINHEAKWYSSVHRGSGFKSRYSTEKYEQARETIAKFCGVDLRKQTVIFTKNTTDAINKISHYLPNLPGEIVIYTRLEHHSNELTWQQGPHLCLELTNGVVDLDRVKQLFQIYYGQIKLLAVTGASNVTGYLPPIYELAQLAHQNGALILVDGAQLIAHRPMDVLPVDDPRHLDLLTFSGHKMYAPFGAGVLIAPHSLFQNMPPTQVGGGTVKTIQNDKVFWAEAPELEEAGSPNLLGALAIAAATQVLTKIGWAKLIQAEASLLEYALLELKKIPRLILYPPMNYPRVGVISFNLEGIYHQTVADFLGEYGIGVRSGCFCARSYVQELLNIYGGGITKNTSQPDLLPGLVRVSFGCYNQISELKILIKTLKKLL